jgi:hypothetical protein
MEHILFFFPLLFVFFFLLPVGNDNKMIINNIEKVGMGALVTGLRPSESVEERDSFSLLFFFFFFFFFFSLPFFFWREAENFCEHEKKNEKKKRRN